MFEEHGRKMMRLRLLYSCATFQEPVQGILTSETILIHNISYPATIPHHNACVTVEDMLTRSRVIAVAAPCAVASTATHARQIWARPSESSKYQFDETRRLQNLIGDIVSLQDDEIHRCQIRGK
jgi:hypothetical protein